MEDREMQDKDVHDRNIWRFAVGMRLYAIPTDREE